MSIGPLMIDVEGKSLNGVDRELLSHPLVGGVILFSRNFNDVTQLASLVEEIHALRKPKLLVAVDQEGGRVQRFREGFVRLPALHALGRVYDSTPDRAAELAEITGWLMAAELRAVGVDISFAPVLDLFSSTSKVIGDRAFHRNPEIVAILARKYVSGMRAAGMEAVGKHFPGHGIVDMDSHIQLPVDTHELGDLMLKDLIPFQRMIHYGLTAIMTAHILFTQVDKNIVTYSSRWIKELLRHEFGFNGAVFSDDVSMCGAECEGQFSGRVGQALNAGCDMVLVCNARENVLETLDQLNKYDNPVSQIRLARLHGKTRHQSLSELHNTERWQDALKQVESYQDSPYQELNL